MKKYILLLFVIFFSSQYASANHTWTSWTKTTPTILSIALEDSIVWCGTSDGVLKYNKNIEVMSPYSCHSNL